VPERQFFADWQRYPSVPSSPLLSHLPDASVVVRSLERTQSYSPFLLNVTLAVGCRYLGSDDDYPPEICGLLGDFDTRGDVFVTWSRYLLDQEWCVVRSPRLVCRLDEPVPDAPSLLAFCPSRRYNPTLSTIRGLLVLGLYLAGRGFDGPCFMFVGLALKLTEGPSTPAPARAPADDLLTPPSSRPQTLASTSVHIACRSTWACRSATSSSRRGGRASGPRSAPTSFRPCVRPSLSPSLILVDVD